MRCYVALNVMPMYLKVWQFFKILKVFPSNNCILNTVYTKSYLADCANFIPPPPPLWVFYCGLPPWYKFLSPPSLCCHLNQRWLQKFSLRKYWTLSSQNYACSAGQVFNSFPFSNEPGSFNLSKKQRTKKDFEIE